MTARDGRHLYLLRHAKSAWDDPGLDDHDRPLAPRGEQAAATMAAHLASLQPPPDLVVCSSAVRTRQTLDRVRDALPEGITEEIEPAIYEATAATILRRLQALPDEARAVLVIGHNPGLEDLTARLAGDADDAAWSRLAAKFPTGALATLTFDGGWSELDWGAARLIGFVTPKDLG